MYTASIIVSINNEYELTINFINNLAQIIDNTFQIILFVDGEADKETICFLEELDKLQNYRVIFNKENIGYSKANNYAVKQAESDLLIFLNSDTFPMPNSLNYLIEAMEDENMGVIQGMLLYPQSLKVQSTGHVFSAYQTKHALDGVSQDNPLANIPGPRQALGSGFYITRKHLFNLYQGFDEFYFNAWEGLEYSLKVHLGGKICYYLPSAKAYHVKGSGRSRMPRNETYQSAYFWSQWGDKIKMDIETFYRNQLLALDYNQTFYLIHASTIKMEGWNLFLKDFKFSIYEIISLKPSLSKKSFSLEDSLPAYCIESSHPLLFLCDHFDDVINNQRIFNYRQNPRDIILDLCGNVIRINEYYQTRGSNE